MHALAIRYRLIVHASSAYLLDNRLGEPRARLDTMVEKGIRTFGGGSNLAIQTVGKHLTN
jgi:hypothetical protein